MSSKSYPRQVSSHGPPHNSDKASIPLVFKWDRSNYAHQPPTLVLILLKGFQGALSSKSSSTSIVLSFIESKIKLTIFAELQFYVANSESCPYKKQLPNAPATLVAFRREAFAKKSSSKGHGPVLLRPSAPQSPKTTSSACEAA